MALVDAELREAVVAGVLVCFADDPGGGVGDAKVQDFSGGDAMVEGLHEFGDGGAEVPPVDVEKVDVVRLEFFERGVEGDLEGFGVVALVVCFDSLWARGEGHGEFGGEDDFVAVFARRHPFTKPGFRFFVLVVVGSVDEVPAVVVEEIEYFERGFLVAFAHGSFPGFAKVQGAEA